MIKPISILFLCVVSANLALAQNAPTSSMPSSPQSSVPSKVLVLKYNWSKELVLPANWDWTPFGAANSSPDSSSANAGSDGEFSTGTLPPVERLPFYFLYWIKVRNTGSQEITGIAWDYSFIDPGSNEELASHRFFSYDLVPANSSFTLQVKSRVPPSKVVSLQGLEKDRRSPYIERVEIKCVMYADGTFWRTPAAKPGDCAYLKLGEKMIERREGQRRQ